MHAVPQPPCAALALNRMMCGWQSCEWFSISRAVSAHGTMHLHAAKGEVAGPITALAMLHTHPRHGHRTHIC